MYRNIVNIKVRYLSIKSINNNNTIKNYFFIYYNTTLNNKFFSIHAFFIFNS